MRFINNSGLIGTIARKAGTPPASPYFSSWRLLGGQHMAAKKNKSTKHATKKTKKNNPEQLIKEAIKKNQWILFVGGTHEERERLAKFAHKNKPLIISFPSRLTCKSFISRIAMQNNYFFYI